MQLDALQCMHYTMLVNSFGDQQISDLFACTYFARSLYCNMQSCIQHSHMYGDAHMQVLKRAKENNILVGK